MGQVSVKCRGRVSVIRSSVGRLLIVDRRSVGRQWGSRQSTVDAFNGHDPALSVRTLRIMLIMGTGDCRPTAVGRFTFCIYARSTYRPTLGIRFSTQLTPDRITDAWPIFPRYFTDTSHNTAPDIWPCHKSSQQASGKKYLFHSPSQERVRNFPCQEGATWIFPRKEVFLDWKKKAREKEAHDQPHTAKDEKRVPRKSRNEKSSINVYNVYPFNKILPYSVLSRMVGPQNRYSKKQRSLTALDVTAVMWLEWWTATLK